MAQGKLNPTTKAVPNLRHCLCSWIQLYGGRCPVLGEESGICGLVVLVAFAVNVAVGQFLGGGGAQADNPHIEMECQASQGMVEI